MCVTDIVKKNECGCDSDVFRFFLFFYFSFFVVITEEQRMSIQHV